MLSNIVKRNKLFRKRKETILKKTHQLATLFEANVMIFFRYETQIIAYNDNYERA